MGVSANQMATAKSPVNHRETSKYQYGIQSWWKNLKLPYCFGRYFTIDIDDIMPWLKAFRAFKVYVDRWKLLYPEFNVCMRARKIYWVYNKPFIWFSGSQTYQLVTSCWWCSQAKTQISQVCCWSVRKAYPWLHYQRLFYWKMHSNALWFEFNEQK